MGCGGVAPGVDIVIAAQHRCQQAAAADARHGETELVRDDSERRSRLRRPGVTPINADLGAIRSVESIATGRLQGTQHGSGSIELALTWRLIRTQLLLTGVPVVRERSDHRAGPQPMPTIIEHA